MSLYGVDNRYSYTDYSSSASNSKTNSTNESPKKDTVEEGATYEASKTTGKTQKPYSKSSSNIVAKMKADTQARLEQMQSLVTKMFQKQGVTIGNADDMWKALANGNFTADAATIAQAKEDIGENGYWGVNQTSDRLVDFAIALSGGDEEKMKKMVSAVEKGFKQATKAWGKDLPGISSDTYSATMDKFDKWFEENGSSTKTSDILGK